MSIVRKIALGVLAALVVGGGFGYFTYVRPFLDVANVGVGFLAKQMCSCIYVAERSFESCRPDMLASMDNIEAETLESPPGVRAWVPVVGERRAIYRGEFGCSLID